MEMRGNWIGEFSGSLDRDVDILAIIMETCRRDLQMTYFI